MNCKKIIALVFILFGVAGIIKATDITGTITDKIDGSPLVGVTVMLDGSTIGVSTDIDGKFSINVKPRSGILNVSYIGYQTVKLPFNGNQEFNISLEEETMDLDEIVVVGYGVQKKSHLTGSISKFDGDKLADIPVTNIDQALQGKIAGVNIQNVDQEAGAAAQIRIRGMGSMTASTDPLVVVDGFPIADGLQFVNMNDVESIEVLKDAASSAIYGSRGANGVIMITTKSGSIKKPKYNVSVSGGVKTPIKKYDIMSFKEYGELLYSEAALRAQDPTWTGTTNLMNVGERAGYVIENEILGDAVDWQSQGIRDFAKIASYQFGVSGGTKELRYFISGNYSQEDGIMYHSTYDKFTFRAKLDATLSKTVKVGVNLSPTYTKREIPANNYTNFWRWFSWSPVTHTQGTADYINGIDPSRNIQAGDWAQPGDFASLPYAGYMPDGEYWDSRNESNEANQNPTPSNSSSLNPKSMMETNQKFQHGYRLQSSAYLQWEPIKNLVFRTSEGAYVNYTENENYIASNSTAAGSPSTGIYTNKLLVDLLSENTVNYLFDIGKHEFNTLIGATFQRTNTNTAGIKGYNFPTDLINTLNGATELDLSATETRKEVNVLISYLARVNYSYGNKYLASASIRTDGSSKFKDNKWGWFPSVSLGWTISDEEFMKPTNSWLKSLKARASFGVTGNNNIDNYAFTDKLRAANYVLGSSNIIAPGLAATDDAFANPYITWEQTNEYNIGVDASFLNNRITASIDYYYAITRQMLFKQAAMAFSGHYEFWNNIGRVRNNGIEVEISSSIISTKDFLWKSTFNASHNSNRLLELGGEAYQYSYGERDEVYAAIVGSSAIQYYGYKTDGVWKTQDEIDASGLTGTSVILGGLKIVDINKDGKIDAQDRTVLGNPFPDFSWGMTNMFTYKNFDLTFSLQGVHGVDVINGDAFYGETKKYLTAFTDNRWVSQQNPGDGKTPYNTIGADWMTSDYVIENGSYVALREVTLGYQIPQNIMQKIKLSSLRIYFSAHNLLYFMSKDYRGLNPEARTTSGAYASPLVNGYQRGAFPLSRTFTFGIDLSF